jgi:acyl carrier protein
MIDRVPYQWLIGLDIGATVDGGTAMNGPEEQQLVAEVIALVRQVMGDDPRWADRVTPSARLDQDLRLDSLEATALASLLREAYGERVDLAAFMAVLGFDALVALTVADLVGYVRACGAGAAR